MKRLLTILAVLAIAAGALAQVPAYKTALGADGFCYQHGYLAYEGAKIGSVFVKNSVEGARDGYVAKIAPDGKTVWVQTITTQKYYSIMGGAVEIGPDGNIYIGGFYCSATGAKFGAWTLPKTRMYSGYLASLDAKGNWLWAKDVPASYSSSVTGITFDGFGNTYITGSCSYYMTLPGLQIKPGLGATDGYVAKLNIERNWEWCKTFGGKLNDGYGGIAYDGRGSLWLVGIATIGRTVTLNFGDIIYKAPTNSIGDVPNGFIALMSATDGKFTYVKRLPADATNALQQVICDKEGNAYVSGYGQKFKAAYLDFDGIKFTYPGGLLDSFVAKFNAGDNKWEWVKPIASKGSDWIYQIQWLPAGHIGVNGFTRDTDGVSIEGVFYAAGDFAAAIPK